MRKSLVGPMVWTVSAETGEADVLASPSWICFMKAFTMATGKHSQEHCS